MELSKSDEDYVFILNDDLKFGSDLLQRLVDYLGSHPRTILQAVGCWVGRKDIIQYAGRRINW